MNTSGISDLHFQKRAFLQYYSYLVDQKTNNRIKRVLEGKVPIDIEIERVTRRIEDLDVRIDYLQQYFGIGKKAAGRNRPNHILKPRGGDRGLFYPTSLS